MIGQLEQRLKVSNIILAIAHVDSRALSRLLEVVGTFVWQHKDRHCGIFQYTFIHLAFIYPA